VGKSDFQLTRQSVTIWAVAGSAVCVIALLLLELNNEKVPGWLYPIGSNVFGVLFGISAVSIIWEFFIRKNHNADLLGYLQLGSSVGQSGLRAIVPESELDWRSALSTANRVTVLARDLSWLDKNAFLILELARRRRVEVVIAAPTPGSSLILGLAAQQGVTTATVEEQNTIIADRATRLWRESAANGTTLVSGGKLRVVGHSFDLKYYVVTIDSSTVVLLDAPGTNSSAIDRIALRFDQSDTGYPSRALRDHLNQLNSMSIMQEATA
jgi:hypothetical protein